ncbi:MAG: hypothetical protein ACKOAR_01090 [Bacteroidota bacterium]
MELLRLLLLIILLLSGLLTVIGIFRPWYALWWSPVQNRLMALKYYGITCLISYVLWKLLDY